jgi:hypothetical protein
VEADMLGVGYRGLLVGTTLLRSSSPGDWFADVAKLRVAAT